RSGGRWSSRATWSAASLTMIPVVWSCSPGSLLRSRTWTVSPWLALTLAAARPAKLAPTIVQSAGGGASGKWWAGRGEGSGWAQPLLRKGDRAGSGRTAVGTARDFAQASLDSLSWGGNSKEVCAKAKGRAIFWGL